MHNHICRIVVTSIFADLWTLFPELLEQTAELYEENGCDWRKFSSSNFIFKVAGSVGDFEKLFEDMDVKTEEMNGALDNVYATSIDNNEVMNLLNEMRD